MLRHTDHLLVIVGDGNIHYGTEIHGRWPRLPAFAWTCPLNPLFLLCCCCSATAVHFGEDEDRPDELHVIVKSSPSLPSISENSATASSPSTSLDRRIDCGTLSASLDSRIDCGTLSATKELLMRAARRTEVRLLSKDGEFMLQQQTIPKRATQLLISHDHDPLTKALPPHAQFPTLVDQAGILAMIQQGRGSIHQGRRGRGMGLYLKGKGEVKETLIQGQLRRAFMARLHLSQSSGQEPNKKVVVTVNPCAVVIGNVGRMPRTKNAAGMGARMGATTS